MSGRFQVCDALTEAELNDREAILGALIPLARALPETPCFELTDTEVAAMRCGHQPDVEWLERLDSPPASLVPGQSPLWRMVDNAGHLVAIGKIEPDPDDPDTDRPRLAVVFPATEPSTGEADSCS